MLASKHLPLLYKELNQDWKFNTVDILGRNGILINGPGEILQSSIGNPSLNSGDVTSF